MWQRGAGSCAPISTVPLRKEHKDARHWVLHAQRSLKVITFISAPKGYLAFKTRCKFLYLIFQFS